MKKFLLAIAAVAALSFSASAFSVEEICGEYNATGINLSQNSGIFGSGTISGYESVDWTMTIEVVEGNKVVMKKFLPSKFIVNNTYPDGYPNVDFDLEGEFDPATNTITIPFKSFIYSHPVYPGLKTYKPVFCKYDGETELGKQVSNEEYSTGNPPSFPSITATFDSDKNLTINNWAAYGVSNGILNLIPTYGADNTIGTYFTPKGSGDSGSSFAVEEICGSYNAKGINLSQNSGIFGSGTISGYESVDWTMTIEAVEGNKVVMKKFLPSKFIVNNTYPDGYPNVDFDLEGEFDPATNTITIPFKSFIYSHPVYPGLKTYKPVFCKYDGETELGKQVSNEEYSTGNPPSFPSITATFDSDKNLTINNWAAYGVSNGILNLIPTYGADNTVGTYFTRETSSIEDVTVESEAPVEYYNLQGVRVAEPTPGLYIRRQGNKVTKVVIR